MTAPLALLIDVGVGKGVEDWLRNAGYDIKAVRDVDPRMDDSDILAWAVTESRLVVTADKDFGELVYRSGRAHAGILLLRVENARSDEKVHIVQEILARYADQLPQRFSVYQDGRLRIR